MSSNEYLVQYGVPAFVGRFAAAGGGFARGERVVVRSPRGPEFGTVLCEPDARFAGLIDPAAGGELLRRATADDEARAAELGGLARRLLAAAGERTAAGVPVCFLDAEALLDGEAVILHALPWGEADLTPLLGELSRAFGLAVRLHDLTRVPVVRESAAGCGKPGCGSRGGCSSGGCSTGGGCGTSGCSRGEAKSADELTAYFADLRAKLEADAARRTALN